MASATSPAQSTVPPPIPVQVRVAPLDISVTPASLSKAEGKVGLLAENIAGGLAYITFIPAVVFLLLSPYNKSRFVRFHSIQCLLLWVVCLAFASALRLLALLLFMIPVAGLLLVWIISVVAVLAALALWFALIVKALQGESFALPLLSDFAEQYSG